MRKTIDRKTVIARANAALRAEDASYEERKAIFYVISSILEEGNAYAGFTYIDVDHNPCQLHLAEDQYRVSFY